jgi:hypothetical protein
MTRGPLKFKETDVKRLVKSTREAGLKVTRVEVTETGSLVAHTDEPANDNASPLERWKRDRDAS